MKTLLLMLCLFTAVNCRCQTNTNSADLTAIKKICSERRNARLANSLITIDHARITRVQLYEKDYVAALKQISTDGLPTQFRLAWFDYVQAWDARSRHSNNARALIDLGEMASATGPLMLKGFADLTSMPDPKDPTREAWVKVERITLEMGLDITHL